MLTGHFTTRQAHPSGDFGSPARSPVPAIAFSPSVQAVSKQGPGLARVLELQTTFPVLLQVHQALQLSLVELHRSRAVSLGPMAVALTKDNLH
jgi:hypothetical protein